MVFSFEHVGHDPQNTVDVPQIARRIWRKSQWMARTWTPSGQQGGAALGGLEPAQSAPVSWGGKC